MIARRRLRCRHRPRSPRRSGCDAAAIAADAVRGRHRDRHGPAAVATITAVATVAAVAARFRLGRASRRGAWSVQNFALVDPGLDADDAVGRVRFGETVIDVGAQGVQRKLPCRYHSVRAISAPFKRPDTRTLIPLQPKRSA